MKAQEEKQQGAFQEERADWKKDREALQARFVPFLLLVFLLDFLFLVCVHVCARACLCMCMYRRKRMGNVTSKQR